MARLQKKSRIVIFGFLGLGDMVQFSACLKILRNGFPDSEIVLVTIWRSVHDLFKESRYIDDSIYFDFFNSTYAEKIGFVFSLRRREFDISILPYPSYRREFNVFGALVGAKKRYSFNFKKGFISEFSFLNNHLVDADTSIHNIENNINLMREIGLKINDDIKYDVPISYSKDFVDRFLANNHISHSDLKIGIHPGSDSRTKDKRLDASKFVEVGDHLASRYDAKILIFLGPHEEDLKKHFTDSARSHYKIVEKMGINEIAQIIHLCDIFISSDSGLMHVASSVGVPTVAIFGPTNYHSLHPWGVSYEIEHLGLRCSPCFSFTDKRPLTKPLIECRIDDKFACMKKIESKSVIEKVDRMVSLLYPERSGE